ncbi:MAG: hypothetical protein ABIK19_05090 [candidate division WOR-3 bacterium]
MKMILQFLPFGLAILIYCGNISRFPNFMIRPYNYSFKDKYISDIVGKNKTIIIFMPLEGCGICINETLNALKKLYSTSQIIILTYAKDSFRKIQIKIVSKEIKENIYFYDIINPDTKNQNKFIQLFSEISYFVTDSNLNILNNNNLPYDENQIIDELTKLDDFIKK